MKRQTTEVPVEDPDKIERAKDGNQYSVKRPNKTVRTCVIRFQDGREMEFRNIPSSEMEAGKRYTITYNELNEITRVVKKFSLAIACRSAYRAGIHPGVTGLPACR